MKMWKQVALWIILARPVADTIGLLIPGTLEFVKRMGWPIDKFWVKSIWPVTAIMSFFGARAILGYETGVYFTTLMIFVPLCWAIVLITHKGSKWLMKVDAMTWIVVAACAYFVK
jgi:hypothetical protein